MYEKRTPNGKIMNARIGACISMISSGLDILSLQWFRLEADNACVPIVRWRMIYQQDDVSVNEKNQQDSLQYCGEEERLEKLQ